MITYYRIVSNIETRETLNINYKKKKKKLLVTLEFL